MATNANEHPLKNSRFLKALRGEAVDATPVWFMRQAGRYMPEYRELRSKTTMLGAIQDPDMATEITLQPINAFNLDAAILFNDILPPLMGMGLSLDFQGGVGPVIHNPIMSTRDVDRLATPPTRETMGYTFKAIEQLAAELTPRGIPLIGFVGSPFTLASYAIEGGGSKNYERTKGLMYSEPAAWKRLMTKFEVILSDYLQEQAKAGASALQIFDSWAGALSPSDYLRFVYPYTKNVIQNAKKSGVPVIYFATGTSTMLPQIASMGSDVVGVDWRLSLNDAWAQLQPEQAIQGNLDPLLLKAPWRELSFQTDRVLQEAAGRPGHVFNLGHGILPGTPVDNVARLADYVHEKTQSGVLV